jgi:outer membrane autotransporter protein
MGGYDNGALFGGAGVAVSVDQYDLNRQTFVPQLRSWADTDGNGVNAFGALGYRFNFGAITAGPLVALRYTGIRIDQYAEQGAPGLDMIVEAQKAEQLVGSAGIAAASQFTIGAMAVLPYLNLSIERNLLDNDRNLASALVTVPDVVRIIEVGEAGDVFGRVNGGVTFDLAPGIKGSVRGETTFGRSGANEHAIYGSVIGRL